MTEVHVEEAFIGSLVLTHAVRLSEVRDQVKTSDFASLYCQYAYAAICDLSANDKLVDPHTVLAMLQARPGQRSNPQVAVWVAELYEKTLWPGNLLTYARLVVEDAVSRTIAQRAEILTQQLKEGSTQSHLRAFKEAMDEVWAIAGRYRVLQKLEQKERDRRGDAA